MAVTIHWIDREWTLQSFVLDIRSVGKSEKSQFLTLLLKSLMEEWGLSWDRVIACTTDGGTNMIKTVRKRLNLMWVYCSAHSFNLSTQKALNQPGLTEVVNKAQRIVKFFRCSTKAAIVLSDQQTRLGLKVLRLKLLVKTRWNSVYDMLSVSSSLATVQETQKSLPPDLTSPNGHY
jgi:hypothetical protein